MTDTNEIKAVWAQFREDADFDNPPVVLRMINALTVIDALLGGEPEILSFEIKDYGTAIVVECEGVIVETLCRVAPVREQ